MQSLLDQLNQLPEGPWLRAIALPSIAIVVGLLVHFVAFAVASRIARRTPFLADDAFVRRVRQPARLGIVFLALQIVLPAIGLGEQASTIAGQLVALGLIAAATWVVIAAIGVADDVVRSRYPIDQADNLDARRMQTRVRVLSRTAMIVVGIVGAASALMIFPKVRQIGVSMLASAGIAGIVVGMAARPTLANLIAGLQIAFTEPIRIDDVVVVDGHWGRIEAITSTYVVVAIWDQRRLVVPLDRMIQQPFENWTRTSSELLGTVFLWVDYSLPVDAVREELQRVLDGDERWDGRTANVQITDANERAVQLRVLVSAKDALELWALRVHVRERLIAFLQEKHPRSLPRIRAELESDGDRGAREPVPSEAGC